VATKIVLVDDDRVTLAVIEKALILDGFWVYSAQDGEEGLELVKREKPDILLSDMLMPKIHGADLCKKVKESQELKHTRVILMSAVYKKITYRDIISESGADDFIEKPVDLNDLKDRINKLLKDKDRE
jgi:DNA-binding response OmpR family regulator